MPGVRAHARILFSLTLIIASLVIIIPSAAGAAASPVPGVSAAAVARASHAAVKKGHATGHWAKATFQAHPPKLTTAQAAALKADTSPSHQVVLGRFAATKGTPAHNPPMPPPHSAAKLDRIMPTKPGRIAPDGNLTGTVGYSRISTLPPLGAGENTSIIEPSTDANGGSNIFETGNVFAARSTDSGNTWSYLNMISLFGAGAICCDEVTQYDPSTGNEFWILQTGSGALEFAYASGNGTNPYSNWCVWPFTPASIGLSGTKFDLPVITVTNSYIWFASDLTGTTNGADVIGIPKSYLTTCSNITYYWLVRTDNQKFMLANGSTGTLYWASDTGQVNGSSFRIFAWPEGSGTYYWWNYTIPSFKYETLNSGQQCGDQSGAVNNWCAFSDSSVDGGYLANGWLGFSFSAKQDAYHVYPFTRIVVFQLSNMAYTDYYDIFNTEYSYQYAAMAPSLNGLVGVEFTTGGGVTGAATIYPNMAIFVLDPSLLSWDNGWEILSAGQGNACVYPGGTPRWGDYLTVRAYYGNANDFIAAGYSIWGGNCGTSGAYPKVDNYLFTG